MPKHSYDVAVLEPQCLLNLTPDSGNLEFHLRKQTNAT